jgi:beta-galactosidase
MQRMWNRTLVFLAIILSGTAFAGPDLPANVRTDTRLDSGWRFKQGEIPDGETTVFDDAGWPTLSLPHSWGGVEAQQGKEYYRGPGWYRRDLNLLRQPGRRYFVRFEAAGSVAN